jgi:hypothetical protein
MNGIKIFSFKYIVVDYLGKFPISGKKSLSFLFWEGKSSRKKISKSSLLFLSSFSYVDLVNIVQLIFV